MSNVSEHMVEATPTLKLELRLIQAFKAQREYIYKRTVTNVSECKGHPYPGIDVDLGDLTLNNVMKIKFALFSEDFKTKIYYLAYNRRKKR